MSIKVGADYVLVGWSSVEGLVIPDVNGRSARVGKVLAAGKSGGGLTIKVGSVVIVDPAAKGAAAMVGSASPVDGGTAIVRREEILAVVEE
jgi:co-chaperonin GroES (HSP10)